MAVKKKLFLLESFAARGSCSCFYIMYDASASPANFSCARRLLARLLASRGFAPTTTGTQALKAMPTVHLAG
jgi:hypothetical protein